MIALLLLLLATPDDGCIPNSTETDLLTPPETPLQKSGRGLWIGGQAFSPDDIASAKARINRYSEAPELEVTFTPSGNAKFLEAQRCGVGNPIEISIDGKVVSRPRLNEKIIGATVVISGGLRKAEVEALAARIAGS